MLRDPTPEQAALEQSLASFLFQRLLEVDQDLAARTGLQSELAYQGVNFRHLTAQVADAQALRSGLRTAASMLSTAAGVPMLINPDRGQLAGLPRGSFVVIDTQGMEPALAAATAQAALTANDRAVVCVLDPGPELVADPQADNVLMAFAQARPGATAPRPGR